MASLDEILRCERCVPGGPWPGTSRPLDIHSVSCWHVKMDVVERAGEQSPSSWLAVQHPTVVVRLTT